MQDNSSIPDPTHTEALPQPSESDLIAPGEGTEDTAVALEPTTEVMPSLEHMLKEAELKVAEHHDAWLRAKAETENVRRRAQEDIAKAGKFSVERFAGELLAVKDSLEAALATEAPSAESLKAGVELTLKQLIAAFEKSRLVEIDPVGEKFDPHKHQAISQIEAPDDITEANIVLTVLQKGYALHERVIRPALVIVSKPKAAPTA